jgi:hypothetical protein
MSEMESGAVLSDCGRYRYRLWRLWDRWEPRALFVMLNPSTADAEQDDPTIRRCIGFAKSWNYGGIEVVNVFALRATDPGELRKHPAPVGPANLSHIEDAVMTAGVVICAWGAHPFAREAAARTLGWMLKVRRSSVMCLRQTKGGHPAHPLYLPADLRPVPFPSEQPAAGASSPAPAEPPKP